MLSDRMLRSMQIVLLLQIGPEQSSILPPRDRRALKSWKTVLQRRKSDSALHLPQPRLWVPQTHSFRSKTSVMRCQKVAFKGASSGKGGSR